MADDNQNSDGTTPKQGTAPLTSSQETTLRAIMARDAAVRQKEEELRQREQDALAGIQLAKLAKENPAKFLSSIGLSPADFAEKAKDVSEPDPIKPVASEVAQLRQQLEAMKAEREKAQMEAVLHDALSQIRSTLSESEEYPTMKTVGDDAYDLVTDAIRQHYQATGELLSEAAVAKNTEDWLSKIAARFRPNGGEESKETTTPQANDDLPPVQTITNDVASQVSARTTSDKLSFGDDLLKEMVEQLEFKES